jgi:SP family general alpha glucoside:H+ symporter-like MFS transporter
MFARLEIAETKNRTFAEMDILFKNKVKARDFENAMVDLSSESVSQY